MEGRYLTLTLLLILFVALKLTGFIDWSWWWVLAPVWAPTIIVLLVVVVTYLRDRNR